MRATTAVAGLMLGLAAPCQEQQTVGELGHWRNIRVEGATAFSPRSIARELALLPDHPSVGHPTAPLSAWLAWAESQVARGYRHNGFPRATVQAEPDPERGELRIRVEEGPRYVCGHVLVEGAGPLGVEIARAFTEPPRRDHPVAVAEPVFWPEGEPADLRPERIRAAWRLAQAACEAAGRWGASGRVEVVYRDDGTADLQVRVEKAGEAARIGRLEWSGSFTDDPAAIAARVDLHVGERCTTGRLAEIRDAIMWLCRYRQVAVRAGEPAANGTVPLLVALEQIPSMPAFEDMPWDDLALLRRSTAWIEDRLRQGATFHWSTRSAHGDAGSRIEGWELCVSRDGVLLQLDGLTVLGVRLGDVVVACDRHRIMVGCEALGGYAIIPVEVPRGSLALWAAPTPDGKSELRWGFGVGTRPADPLVVQFHPAVMMRFFEGSVESSPERLRVVAADGALRLEVERDSAATSLSWRDELAALQLEGETLAVHWRRAMEHLRDKGCAQVTVHELGRSFRDFLARQVAELEVGPDPAVPHLVVAGWNAGLRALESGALGPLVRDGDFGPRFTVPREPAAVGDEIVELVMVLRSVTMDQVAYDSWAFVEARDLSGLAFLRSREMAQAAWSEMRRLWEAGRFGPLACAAHAQTWRQLGWAEAAAEIARLGTGELDYEAFWQDVLAIAPADSIGGNLLGAFGTAWRELYTEREVLARREGWTDAALEAITGLFSGCDPEDPMSWAEAGFRRFWEHGLRAALVEYLDRVAR